MLQALESRRYSERALATKKEHYAENDVEHVISWENLGLALLDVGNALDAKSYLSQTLSVNTSHYGNAHMEVAKTTTVEG